MISKSTKHTQTRTPISASSWITSLFAYFNPSISSKNIYLPYTLIVFQTRKNDKKNNNNKKSSKTYLICGDVSPVIIQDQHFPQRLQTNAVVGWVLETFIGPGHWLCGDRRHYPKATREWKNVQTQFALNYLITRSLLIGKLVNWLRQFVVFFEPVRLGAMRSTRCTKINSNIQFAQSGILRIPIFHTFFSTKILNQSNILWVAGLLFALFGFDFNLKITSVQNAPLCGDFLHFTHTKQNNFSV